MPYVTLDGIRFHYQQAGQGRDVVLIHAATSNLSAWMFSGVMADLARDYRVTAYDLRGHGQSEVTPTGYTSADMAGDLARLHAALGLGPAYLIGHSFGAVVATHAAVLHPALVAALVLSDPYFPGLAHLEPDLGQSHVWQDLRQKFLHAGIDLGDAADFTRLFQTVAGLTPEQFERLKEAMGPMAVRWLAPLPRLAPTTCGRDIFAEAGLSAERITSVAQPVLALYDEHTSFRATSRYLPEHLPTCTMQVVPHARHFAPLENPTDFVALVRQFLQELKSSA